MPLDYNQRINELLKDNPYAAELGYGQEPAAPADPAEEPDFSHLLQPITATTPAPTGPDLDAPDFSHLLAPIESAATPGYVGPTDQNYLQQGVNTATRRMTAGALNVAGGTLQGLARDPLGPVGWIPGLRGLADVAQPEQPIGWLQGAGQWAKDTAASPELAAPPGWAGGWTDTIASAVGSTIPFAATAAIPGGAAVSISSGAILGSYAALDEQVQEAIRNGATEEQIKKASRLASTGGLTEPIPLEIIFNRIPLPGLAKGAVQIAGRLLAKAAAEGGQEAVQTAVQNFSENYVYNPDQDLTEGLAQAFGIGAIVGTGFAVPAELAAGKAAPTPAPAPGVTPPAAGVTTPAGTPPPPAPGVAPGVTPPAPSVTTPPVIPSAPTGMPSVPSVIPPPAPIAADEDALPDLLPMPEEEEPVVPEPVVAPVAELPAAPEQPEVPLEVPAAAAPAAPVAAPAAPAAPLISTPPLVPAQQQPLGPTAAPAVALPEQGDAEGVDVSHLLQPIGTRRTPAPPQFAGDRVNLKASDAQRQARNAEIGHYRWQPGINVGIEVPAGGTRRAIALPGIPTWEAQLPPGVAHGRIKGTRTRKREIKAFIGSTPNDQVFLIDQIDPTTGKFDEPKVMLDFQSQEEARNAYISSYSDGRGAERIGSISAVPVADFRAWLKSPRTQRPFDRKATAASRRLRQAYTAEAKAQQQAPAEAARAAAGGWQAQPMQVKSLSREEYEREQAAKDQSIIDRGGTVGPLVEAAPSEDQGIPGGPEAATAPEPAQAGVLVQQEEAAPSVPEGEAAPQRVRRKRIRFLPSSQTLSTPPVPTDEVLRRLGRVEKVPLESMRGTQSKMDWDRTDATRGGPGPLVKGYGDKPIVVRKEDGEYLVFDGHHRAVSAINAGQDTIEAYVIDAKDYAPEQAGRKRQPPSISDDELLRQLQQPTQEKETEHAPRVRGYPRPYEEGHATEGGQEPRGSRVQSKASGAPSDRAPQREEEQPAQQEGLAERWDKLPLEQKEAALKAAKVARSPITRWKDLGEANQQKLQAAEASRTVSAAPAATVPQILTAAFKRWFGKSKVVDAQGKPLRMYHGSVVWTKDGRKLGDFHVFDRRASVTVVKRPESMDTVGSWFSDTPGDVKTGAGTYAGGQGTIYPVWLSIQNPWRPRDFDEFFNKMYTTAGQDPKKAHDRGQKHPTTEPLRKWLKSHGYDGIVFPTGKVDDVTQTVWVALEPEQIKSAIANKGTFDPTKPDIQEKKKAKPSEDVPADAFDDVRQRQVTLADQFEDIAAAQNEAMSIIQRIAGRVRVNFKDILEPNDAEGWGGARATEGPAGTFEFWRENGRMVRRLIEVSLDQSPAEIQNTAFHEAWHAIERAIGRANLRVLKAEMPRLRNLVAAEFRRLKITDIDASKLSEQEVMAIAFARYGQGRVRGIHTGIRRYFEAVKQFLRRLGNALRSGDFKTAEDVFGSAYTGEFAGPLSKQDLSLFEQGNANVQASLSLGRRPVRPPDPGATFATPQETRVLTGLMGKLGKEGVNVSQWNRRIADQYEAAQRLNTELVNTGAAIPEVLNPYNAMLAYSGRTSARGFQTEQQFTKPIMKRLNRIQKAIGRSGTTFEDFNKYLIAKHAAERNAYLRSQGSTIADPSGMSDAEAANIVAAAHPEFAAIAPEVYKLLRETADLQLKSGLIDQETYDLITNRYSFYVPLQGWVEAEGDETVATGQGFDVRGREFHAATGRFSMADAPLAYALQGANRAIVRAEKNRVLQVLNRLVQRFPNSEFWQRDRAVKEDYWYEHTDPTTGTVTREIRQRWVPPQTLARSKDGLKNTVVVKEKGVPHYITIHNQPMLEAVRSLGAEEMNGLLRTMGTVLRGIGKLYTTYNPIFIIRNFFRDLQTALLTMQEENLKGLGWSVVKRLKKSGGGMHRYLRGKPKPAREADDPALWHAHEYARAGGMVGWMEQHSIEKQKDRLQRAIDGKNFSNKVGAAFEVIENANAAVENAVRLSLYMELIGRGYSKQRAALAAKEVTTNFNRKGQWGQAINSLYIFFNARVQGAARIGRVLRNPRAKKVQIAALGVLPAMGFLTSLVNRIMGGDDDDGLNAWDTVPQYEKEKNFIVMNPWGTGYLKIPMSYGYNAFYVVGQQMEAAMANMVGYGDGVEPQTAAWNVYHAISNATSPVDLMRAGWSGFVPTLAAPFTEMAENLNYQGAPLYPTKYNPKDPDAELYFRGVNPFWKGVARELERFTKYDRRKPAAIDVSPESMEHLFNTYFGGLGQLGSQSFNLGLNAGRLAMGYPIDIELPRDIPVVREVLGTENNPFTRQNMYYEVWDKIDSLTADIKDKELTSKEAKQQYPLEYALKSEFESAQKRLREQRERRKKIDNNPRLSSTERQRRLDAVEDKMDDIRSGALQDYAEELKRQRTGATLH